MAQNETQQHSRTLDIDKKIVDNIDNGIIILNDALKIYHYNKWLELHTKIKEQSVLDKKLDDIFTNIKTKTLIRKIKTALKMNSPTFYSASTSKYLIPIKIQQIKNSHFEYMQQDVSIIPFDTDNSLVALIITDQTNMANTNAVLESHIEKVKELNAELMKERSTIDKKILFLKFDNNGDIYDVSEALVKLLQHKKEELLHTNFFLYNQKSLTQEQVVELQTSIKELKVYTFEQKIYTTKEKELWFKSTLVPEYNSKGEHLGFILFKENISDAKALERNHEKMLANSRSAAMGDMISMIAHQWRQPLSLINTILITIRIKKEVKQLDKDSLDTYFKKIEATTQYLSETIDDFREYFKPNKNITKVNLQTVFDKSIFFLKGEMSQRKIEYTLNVDEKLTIITFKNELLQSIINIIKNSIDAFVDTQENKNIIVTIHAHKESVSIVIQDNAGGIPDDIIDKIYEPYFSTKSKNGTGLGLYICQTIINEHLHGELSISSKDEKTKVHIKLPYKID